MSNRPEPSRPLDHRDRNDAIGHHSTAWEVVDLLDALYKRYPDDPDLAFARLSDLGRRLDDGANRWAERIDDHLGVDYGTAEQLFGGATDE